MSHPLPLFLIVLSASVALKTARCEAVAVERDVANWTSEGWKMNWLVSDARLESASRWDGASEPRLSPLQAVAKAREYLRSRDQASELPVTAVKLEHPHDAPSSSFVYHVEFDGGHVDPKHEKLVIVLLDGSVITPVRTDSDSIKSVDLFPSSEMVEFMERAKAVYVFPLKGETATRPDDKDLRLLDTEAKQALVAVLSNQANWYHGLMNIGVSPYPRRSIGFLFRAGKDELILWFSSDYTVEATVEGTFRGKPTLGLFVQCAGPAMEKWKQRYARRENEVK